MVASTVVLTLTVTLALLLAPPLSLQVKVTIKLPALGKVTAPGASRVEAAMPEPLPKFQL